MREHIETLIVAVGDFMRNPPQHAAPAEPRSRRPRRARSTYVAVRRGTSRDNYHAPRPLTRIRRRPGVR